MSVERGSKRTLRALAALVVVLSLLAACGAEGIEVSGQVTAAPACPTSSGQASCAPMPLSDLQLTVVSAGGSSGLVVAQPVTDAQGAFSVRLQPGSYRIHGAGIPGATAPSPIFFTVSEASPPPPISIVYDTGIR